MKLPAETTPDSIALADIVIDGGTQPRGGLSIETVADYQAAMEEGAKFPPLTIYFDGVNHWLADGFHRYHACRQIGLLKVTADIRTGTVRDAILYAVGANTSHGLRRSNADKRRAVHLLLKDDEWRRWSDRSIAAKCGVGHQLVSALRAQLDESSSSRNGHAALEATVGRDGKTRKRKRRDNTKSIPRPAPIDDEDVGENGGEAPTNGRTPVGVLRGHEALNSLTRIPKNDGQRERGLQIVTDWIDRNGEPAPAEELPLHQAIEKLRAAVVRVARKWPAGQMELFGNYLHTMGDEVLEHGGLRELQDGCEVLA